MVELARREAASRASVALMFQALEMMATMEPRPNKHEHYHYGADEIWEDDLRLQPPTYDERDQLPHYSAEPTPPQYGDCETVPRRQLRRCGGMGNLSKTYRNGVDRLE